MLMPWEREHTTKVDGIGLASFVRDDAAPYHRFRYAGFHQDTGDGLAPIDVEAIQKIGYTLYPLNSLNDGYKTTVIKNDTRRAFVASNRDPDEFFGGRFPVTRNAKQGGIVLDGLTDCVFDGLSFLGTEDFNADTGGIVIRNCKRLFFRDCCVRRFRVGWSIENSQDIFIQHALTAECLMYDPAHHCQGLWMKNSSVTMWNSAFIDCGRSEKYGVRETKFRHSCYCSVGSNIDFRGIITIDSAAHGIQARGPHSIVRDYVSLGDAVGIAVGIDDPQLVTNPDGSQAYVRPVPGGVYSVLENIYVQGHRDIVTHASTTATAWGVKARNIKEANWKRLCMADHASVGSARGFIIDGSTTHGSCGIKFFEVDQVYSRNGGRLQVIPGVLQNVSVSKAEFPAWEMGRTSQPYEVMPGAGDNRIVYSPASHGAKFIRPLNKAAIREALINRARGTYGPNVDAASLISEAIDWEAR